MIVLSLNTVALLALRGISFYLKLQGQKDAAVDVDALADATAAGKVSDDHMRAIADAIKAGTSADFADIRKRIEEHTASLLSRVPSDAPTTSGVSPTE